MFNGQTLRGPGALETPPSARRVRRELPFVAAGLGIIALAATALADPPHPPGPPPEAFTACDGKAAGDACSVSLHGTEVAGTCSTPPGNQALACRPNRPPPPPPQAFSACDNKSVGADCSLQIHGADASGVCRVFPGDTRLACAPNGPPPAPPDEPEG